MEAARVWPDFRAEHVLFEDDDLLVVHKPVGVSSQAAHPDRPDDLLTRLHAARGQGYLGVHHRLDRDTSGCVLFTKRPAVNAAIASAFEGREVEKRYLAAVRGWPARRDEAVLDDVLVEGDDGRMAVAARGRSARGKRAVTRVRVKKRSGDRALLELVLETGRTHQARVQLAHAGAPIAGDILYDGPRAARLMLHAASMGIAHPVTKKRLVVRDTIGARTLERWVDRGDAGDAIYDDVDALDEALFIAVERRWGLGRSADRDPAERATTAFRLVHEDGDALPALAVDVYRERQRAWLVAQFHLGPVWDVAGRRERVLDRLDALGFDGVYLKLRPKQANVLVDTRRDDVAPKAAVRGASADHEPITILEEGAPHRVWLGDGLSTGIFLDQRPNRVLVRSLAKGKRVLNLFAYTCAFSVVAALGGAVRTVSVDASLAALERGRASFVALGFDVSPAVHAFAGEDAFAWLARAASKPERFDLVIVDPPSYSSTKKRRFVADADYGELVAMAAAVTAPGGRIVACCNHRGLGRAKLRRMIGAGVRDAKRTADQIKDLPTAPDFPPPPGADPQMKSMLVTLR